jgi:hypothetical protein
MGDAAKFVGNRVSFEIKLSEVRDLGVLAVIVGKCTYISPAIAVTATVNMVETPLVMKVGKVISVSGMATGIDWYGNLCIEDPTFF